MYKPRPIILLPFLSSILLWLSYHPVNLHPLIWIAPVPFFIYIFYEENRRRLYLCSYLSGMLFFFLGLYWLRWVTWAGLFAVILILGLYFLLFAVLTKIIQRRFGLSLYIYSIPFLWVFLDYLRSFLLSGFPWLFFGHTQYYWLGLIQITDLVGVYGVSFLILVINSLITLFIISRFRELPRKFQLTKMIVFTVILFGLTLGYGYIRLANCPLKDGPVIGIVQGNIEQGIKLDRDQSDKIYKIHYRLSRRVARQRPDLMVWPETMFPYVIGRDASAEEVLSRTVRKWKIPMLIGAITDQAAPPPEEYNRYNSAYYLDPDGSIIGRYDKMHLVPVSEAPTIKNISPYLDKLAREHTPLGVFPCSLTAGENIEPMKLGGHKFGVLICYESIFPELVRRSVNLGADFIINISNDGWFKDSAELEQMLTITIFRCVENKISIVRATNTGISAFISPRGEVKILKDKDGQSKEVRGTLISAIQLGPGHTLYTRRGDWFPFICLAVLLLLILYEFLKIHLRS